MIIIILLKLSAIILSVALGAGILARDHALKVNRIIAAFFFCNAIWAAAEFVLYQTSNPDLALVCIRTMAVGWVPLGILCMHASLNLSSLADRPIARTTPYFYLAIGCVLPFAVGTEFFIAGVEGDAPGVWRPIFGWGLAVGYALMAIPILTTLVSLRRLMKLPGRSGQNELVGIVFYGVGSALILGTITAIVVPISGGHVVGVTTTLLTLVGIATSSTLRRHGYSLISPEAFAREIFDTLDDSVVVLSEDGTIRDANRAFRRLIDERHSELIGTSISVWFPRFPIGDKASEKSIFIDLWTRGGEHAPVVISSSVRITDRMSRPSQVFLLRDRREVISLQRQIAVSGRLAAVGDLSKSISESIQGPAQLTRGYLEKLAADWQAMLAWLDATGRLADCREEVAEGVELIEECLEGVDRVNAIVQQVGSFSAGVRPSGFSNERLGDVVSSAMRIARVQADPSVEVEVRFDPDVRLMCNRTELERVVTNVIVNAFHALEAKPPGEAHLSVAVGSQGERALLHVEDDGCGISSEALDRVFDPFFTTKPVGKGTGLGLAISYHIVKKHRGEIRVSSVEGSGTSVAIEMPRVFEDRP